MSRSNENFGVLVLIAIIVSLVATVLSKYPLYSLLTVAALVCIVTWRLRLSDRRDRCEALRKGILIPETMPDPNNSLSIFLAACVGLDDEIVRRAIPIDFLKVHSAGAALCGRFQIESQQLEISDKQLPHKLVWRHACMDGSPDLRYSSNASHMITKRITARCTGADAGQEFIFHFPPDSLEDDEGKVRFLIDILCWHPAIGAHREFNSIFTQICSHMADLAHVRGELNSISELGRMPGGENRRPVSPKLRDRFNSATDREGKICLKIGELDAAAGKIINRVKEGVIQFREERFSKEVGIT